MDLHRDLFEGPPPPQARTAPVWPGYDPEPKPETRRSFLAWLVSSRRTRPAPSA